MPAIKIGFVNFGLTLHSETPPSAKKPRKNYTLDYKLRIVEASKNSVSQRAFAEDQKITMMNSF